MDNSITHAMKDEVISKHLIQIAQRHGVRLMCLLQGLNEIVSRDEVNRVPQGNSFDFKMTCKKWKPIKNV